jgi:hypothetical protein
MMSPLTIPAMIAGVVSSVVLVETVFAWPGIGRLGVSAVLSRDYPVIVAVVTLTSLWAPIAYFLVSAFYALLMIAFRAAPVAYNVAGQIPSQYPRYPGARRALDTIFTGASVVAGVVFLGIALVSFDPSIVTEAEPLQMSIGDTLLPPGSEGHRLGTDDLGRDVLARLLHGGRKPLEISAEAAALALAIGLIAGVFSGVFDGIAGRVLDTPIHLATVVVNAPCSSSCCSSPPPKVPARNLSRTGHHPVDQCRPVVREKDHCVGHSPARTTPLSPLRAGGSNPPSYPGYTPRARITPKIIVDLILWPSISRRSTWRRPFWWSRRWTFWALCRAADPSWKYAQRRDTVFRRVAGSIVYPGLMITAGFA